MELQIFNSIIHGSLNPRFELSPQGTSVPYGELYEKLNREYRDIPDLEEFLASVLEDYIEWDFSDTRASFLGPDDISQKIHKYPVKVTFNSRTESPSTEKDCFYQILLRLETDRIRQTINRYALTTLNIFDIRMEVMGTIEKIEILADGIRDEEGRIFNWIKESLLKLYSEIYSLYYSVISEDDIITYNELFYKLYGKYPTEQDALHFARASLTARLQETIFSGEPADIKWEKEIEAISRLNPEAKLLQLCLWYEAIYLAGRYGFVNDDLEKPVNRRALLREIRAKLRKSLSGETTQTDKERLIEEELESIPESTLPGSPITAIREFLLDEQRRIEDEENARRENPYKKRDGLRLIYRCTSESLKDCLDSLTKTGLVDGRTSFIDFRKSFTGLNPGTKINWTGTIPELTAFFKEIKSQRLLEDAHAYWDKVARVYVHNGEAMTGPQLRMQHTSARDRMTSIKAVQMLTQ